MGDWWCRRSVSTAPANSLFSPPRHRGPSTSPASRFFSPPPLAGEGREGVSIFSPAPRFFSPPPLAGEGQGGGVQFRSLACGGGSGGGSSKTIRIFSRTPSVCARTSLFQKRR